MLHQSTWTTGVMGLSQSRLNMIKLTQGHRVVILQWSGYFRSLCDLEYLDVSSVLIIIPRFDRNWMSQTSCFCQTLDRPGSGDNIMICQVRSMASLERSSRTSSTARGATKQPLLVTCEVFLSWKVSAASLYQGSTETGCLRHPVFVKPWTDLGAVTTSLTIRQKQDDLPSALYTSLERSSRTSSTAQGATKQPLLVTCEVFLSWKVSAASSFQGSTVPGCLRHPVFVKPWTDSQSVALSDGLCGKRLSWSNC